VGLTKVAQIIVVDVVAEEVSQTVLKDGSVTTAQEDETVTCS
jgi:hypothetical protein